MGYDVHITRAKDWLDSKKQPIKLKEWLAYVANDPEMRLDGVAEAHIDGQPVLTYENEGLAVWIGRSGHQEIRDMVWFDFRNGRVAVKNPSKEVLEKMKQIAAALGANVVGDEGELY